MIIYIPHLNVYGSHKLWRKEGSVNDGWVQCNRQPMPIYAFLFSFRLSASVIVFLYVYIRLSGKNWFIKSFHYQHRKEITEGKEKNRKRVVPYHQTSYFMFLDQNKRRKYKSNDRDGHISRFRGLLEFNRHPNS